jgi:primosomal protein N' (replication factor Y)
MPAIGGRVRVPVGGRRLIGWVVAHGGSVPPGGVKPIDAVIDNDAAIPGEVMALCRWTADYYLAGLGDTLRMAMPPAGERGTHGFKVVRRYMLTAAGRMALDGGATRTGPALTTKQIGVLRVASSSDAGSDAAALRTGGGSPDVIRRLVARGLLAVAATVQERDPFVADPAVGGRPDPGLELTGLQEAALARLESLAREDRFSVALLHGVTGSGKTEVYRRLVASVLRTGRRALVLVPEIALTPAVASLFRESFGERVAIQHSALSSGERHDQWQRIRRGAVDVVVGTRSAVFAPLDRLALVIVDEEHDGSYKQEEAPRYHGRDVAIVRARAAGALVVLGSATPSLESYQHAMNGKYLLVTLGRRVLDRPLASVTLVDMRREYAEVGPDVVLSRRLVDAIAARLDAHEQVVVLLNRRGYATAVFCRQCGDAFECPNCSVSLTAHRGTARRDSGTGADARVPRWGRCHYCNYSMRLPTACRRCAAPYLEQAGFGTERVEQELTERFPGARIGRVDRDSTRRRGALVGLLSAFSRGELDVLVGTQMLAKGHDFPRVTLVGVVSADVGLGLPDFRASERTFQLLTQVAGRAGRGGKAGEAIVQTLYPDHYSVQCASSQDYAEFFRRELEYRRAMEYPPLTAMIALLVRGRTQGEALELGGRLADRLRARLTKRATVLGPAPAPLTRLKGEYRVQIFLKGTHRGVMREAVREVLSDPAERRRTTVDVDPLSVL